MKKFIFAFVCIAALSACGSKPANEIINPTVDSTAVDSTFVTDSVAVDSTAIDTLQ